MLLEQGRTYADRVAISNEMGNSMSKLVGNMKKTIDFLHAQ